MTMDGDLFPEGLPTGDLARWTSMTAGQRTKAGRRIAAIRGWLLDGVPVDAAIKLSGLSSSRFYRLAAEWRAAPSLAAVGALAGSGAVRTRLDPDAVNALQAVVSDVVRLNAGATVSQLVRMMVERSGVTKGLPSAVRLRQIVEDEQRRVAATHDAGHAVRFDLTAVNLPRADGRPFVMFACVDTGTRLILGAAMADEPVAAVGYRAVATDALARIDGPLAELPWAIRLTQAEMSAGMDLDASVDIVDRLMSHGVPSPQLARSEKRFGAYLRKTVGERIGRIGITPKRTASGLALPDNGDMSPWTLAEANAALATAVNDYNDPIAKALADHARGRPPEGLILALYLLATG